MERFSEDEVIYYLEEKLADNIATEEEEKIYTDYKWFGVRTLNKNTYAWKNLIMEMRDIYENGYK